MSAKEWIVSELVYSLVPLLFAAKWFLICLALFTLLTILFKDIRTQPLFRRSLITDSLYWLICPLFYRFIGFALNSLILIALYSSDAIDTLYAKGLSPAADLPLWLQIIMILIISDFLQYWIHRAFHTQALWKYHAVHHSSSIVDWLSSARFHPVNIIFYLLLTQAIVLTLGFSPKAFGALVVFNILFSPLVHTNLKWSFGPLRYVFVSPTFHRWHHAQEASGKNFAQTFSFLDLAFGTFYMPRGQHPEHFGTPDDYVPEDFIGQLIYPFRQRTASPANAAPSIS